MRTSLLEFVADGDDMSPRRTMELLWADAVNHLPQTDGEVFLPRNVIDEMLDINHLKDMGIRLAAILNKKVQIVLDESMDAYRMFPKELNTEHAGDLGPDQHGIELDEHLLLSKSIHNAGDSVKIPARPTKVPRPPNCFILYRQANHHLVKNANPGVSNNEISRILGARWNNETPEVRQQFTRLADDLKKEHAIKHPDYQYAPRRPSERRRRIPRIRTSYTTSDNDYQYPCTAAIDFDEDFDEHLIPIDDNYLSDLSNNGLLFGPNGVEPLPAPYSYGDRMEISNELASGNNFASLDYIPMPFGSNINKSGILTPTIF
ncbi:High mobility group superfamily [Penicillium concentricum]|uniref:High mobility group superfamily n=1 Tax=Penicillium concentricum TaxID=293559 RepID=A0A9W9S529_9EURO|nr:High mobility group superfamily [Penicillium concentricum]KAJ5372202.1 High mobility group superfamily [Penicillium concentricum]